jgi:two-component system LytT family response regulator
MNRYRLVLVDDEPLARRGLLRLLAPHRDFEVVGQCRDGEEAIEMVPGLKPDLLLLDIQLPGRNGFQVLEALAPEERPATIFVTAYDAHALQAFEVHAVDYVLKPVHSDRFDAALQRARERLAAAPAAPPLSSEDLGRLAAFLGSAPPAAHLERFLVRTAGGVHVVPARDVRYLEADGDYVLLHRAGRPELMRATLHSLEARLDPRAFVRVHRSFVVRIDEVREVRGSAGGDGTLLLQDGTELPFSRTYREKLLEALD